LKEIVTPLKREDFPMQNKIISISSPLRKVSDEYKTLYHYTTWDGLIGIIENQCLWATHYRFLNDYSELALMKDKLIDLAKPIIRNECQIILDTQPDREQTIKRLDQYGGLEYFVDNNASTLVTAMYETLPCEGPYITSFCAESKDHFVNDNGLLSQWRGYGRDGGFALVFETLGAESLMKTEISNMDYELLGLSTVVYSNDEHTFKHEFQDQLGHMRGYITAMMKSLQARELSPTTQDNKYAWADFMNCISRYKHQGFKEENEVRICATFFSKGNLKNRSSNDQLRPEKERKFRNKNGERVPYIELFSSLHQDLPIKRIIVGPHRSKDARVSALKVMLRGKHIEVTASDIPFFE
jgi:hypothetical protein